MLNNKLNVIEELFVPQPGTVMFIIHTREFIDSLFFDFISFQLHLFMLRQLLRHFLTPEQRSFHGSFD